MAGSGISLPSPPVHRYGQGAEDQQGTDEGMGQRAVTAGGGEADAGFVADGEGLFGHVAGHLVVFLPVSDRFATAICP